MARPVLWTKPKILDALRDATARLGRVPKSDELWRGEVECPSITVIRRNFGTVRAALLAAGLTPRPVGGRVKHGQRRRSGIFDLPPIDPHKAAQITEAKRDYWLNGGRSTWVHPYARLAVSRSAAPASTATLNISSRRSA